MYSEKCKKCIVEGCPDSCHVKQEYMLDSTEPIRKTFIVYLPTGAVFVNADGYIKFDVNDKEMVFYNKDGYATSPIAQFNRNNIYGWSEYNA